MDFFSHLFWSAIIFRSSAPLWAPIFFGALPDLSSWGILFGHMIATGKFMDNMKNFRRAKEFKHPDFSSLPKWAWTLYGAGHSIFSFAAVFAVLSFITGQIFIPALAWLVHILMDIPTHSKEFLPTPFLWPLSKWVFPGYSWGSMWFTLANWGSIIISIIYFFGIRGFVPKLF